MFVTLLYTVEPQRKNSTCNPERNHDYFDELKNKLNYEVT